MRIGVIPGRGLGQAGQAGQGRTHWGDGAPQSQQRSLPLVLEYWRSYGHVKRDRPGVSSFRPRRGQGGVGRHTLAFVSGSTSHIFDMMSGGKWGLVGRTKRKEWKKGKERTNKKQNARK